MKPGNDAEFIRPEPSEQNEAAACAPWPLTVATYNIHAAVGGDGKFAPERIAAVLLEMDADVVALQEVPLGGEETPDVLSYLQHVTGFAAAEGPTFERRDLRYGNAVLTRFPIVGIRTIDLSMGHREPRGALDADIVCHDSPLRVVATHLGLFPAERRQQIKRLLDVFYTEDMALMLLGDINEWFVWGRPLRWLEAHFQRAPAPRTFPSGWPIFSLDRIWIRPPQRLLEVWPHRTPLSRVASDHLPLLARIGGSVR